MCGRCACQSAVMEMAVCLPKISASGMPDSAVDTAEAVASADAKAGGGVGLRDGLRDW